MEDRFAGIMAIVLIIIAIIRLLILFGIENARPESWR